MSGAPPVPGACAHCGGTNLPTATFCQYCGSALTYAPPSPPAPRPAGPDSFQLATAPSEPRSSTGTILLIFGVFLALAGVAGLGVAAVVSQGVQMFNQGCAKNPLCTPEADPSGAITAVAVVLLVVGVLLALGGFRMRSD